VGEYRKLYARGAYLPQDYRQMLHDRVAPLIGKYRLAGDRRSFRQPSATVPAVASAESVAEPLQPTLF
jgi:hypothetical protein